LKIASFLDYIGAIGSSERVALMLARALRGDIVKYKIDFRDPHC
jgi:hypothetical protein